METIISMSPFSIKLFIFGLAIIGLGLTFYYRIDGFDSDPNAGTRGCDSSCSNGGYSKITGKPCCNTGNTSVDNDDKICDKLPNGKTECHNTGATGDTKGYKTGNVSSWDGNAAGDAGRTSARLGAGDTDLELSADLTKPYLGSSLGRGNSDSGKGSDELTKEELELLQGSRWYSGRNGSKGGYWSNSNPWLNGRSGSKGGKWDDDDKKYTRKTVDELIDHSKKGKDVPGIGDDSKDTPKKDNCPTDDESLANLLDNRIKSCKKLMERSFERPSEEKYDKGAKKGHDTCNKFKSLDNNDEEEVCEGFSPIL